MDDMGGPPYPEPKFLLPWWAREWPLWCEFGWLQRGGFYVLPSLHLTRSWGSTVLAIALFKWAFHIGIKEQCVWSEMHGIWCSPKKGAR